MQICYLPRALWQAFSRRKRNRARPQPPPPRRGPFVRDVLFFSASSSTSGVAISQRRTLARSAGMAGRAAWPSNSMHLWCLGTGGLRKGERASFFLFSPSLGLGGPCLGAVMADVSFSALAGSAPVVATNSIATWPASATRSDMLEFLRFVLRLAVDLLRSRAELLAENALLRQQLIVAQRKIVGRVRWAPWERLTMALAARVIPAWRAALLLVKPATLLRWHRAGF